MVTTPAMTERKSRGKRLVVGLAILASYWTFITVSLDWIQATVGVGCIGLYITLKERRLRRLARGE